MLVLSANATFVGLIALALCLLRQPHLKSSGTSAGMTDNKRLRQMQDAESLKDGAMSPQDAARVVCEAHTHLKGVNCFFIEWGRPNFSKGDDDLYREAWRVLRKFAGVDDSELPAA